MVQRAPQPSQVSVENCFGRFKGRWRRLLKRSEVHYAFVPPMAFACVILHNIVEGRGDPVRNAWLEEADLGQMDQPPGDVFHGHQGPHGRHAAALRERISDELWALRE